MAEASARPDALRPLGSAAPPAKGTDTPYHAFETMFWAGINGDTQRLGEVTIPGENRISLKDRPPLMKIKGVQMVSVEGYPSELTRVGAIVEEEFYGGGLNAPPGNGSENRLVEHHPNKWRMESDRSKCSLVTC